MVRENLKRGAVLTYVVVLWLAVWPFENAPLLGEAQRAAEGLLGRASLYAGMAVFAAPSSSANLPWVDCTKVLARSQGEWKHVYAPECPRKGTLFLENNFDQSVTRMLRKAGLPRLARSQEPNSPNAMRHVVQINDYFCQAEPGIDRVALHWTRVVRNYETGEFKGTQVKVVCASDCNANTGQLPRCSLKSIVRRTP